MSTRKTTSSLWSDLQASLGKRGPEIRYKDYGKNGKRLCKHGPINAKQGPIPCILVVIFSS